MLLRKLQIESMLQYLLRTTIHHIAVQIVEEVVGITHLFCKFLCLRSNEVIKRCVIVNTVSINYNELEHLAGKPTIFFQAKKNIKKQTNFYVECLTKKKAFFPLIFFFY